MPLSISIKNSDVKTATLIKRISDKRLAVKGPPKFNTIRRNHAVVSAGIMFNRPLFNRVLRE